MRPHVEFHHAMKPSEKQEKASQKQKRDIIITSILLIIFAFTFTKNVLLRKKNVPVPTPVSAEAPEQALSVSDQLVYVTNLRVTDQMRVEQRAVWEKEWGRDPFVPQTLTAVVKAVNLILQGILWDEKDPKAIVNEKTLGVGDTIYGYAVENIRPRSVVLKTGEKTVELNLFSPVASSESS